MLLVQMAVLRYYDKYNKYPDHWEELQRVGFLGKMPKSLIPDEDLIISAPFDPENEEGKKIMKKIASKDYERVKNARFFMVTGNKSLNYRFQIDYNSALHDRSFRLKNEECISGRNWHFSKVPVIYDPRIQVALYLKGPTGRTDQKDSPDGR